MKNDSTDKLTEEAKAASDRIATTNETQEFLANENIFLAWIRTGLAFMSLGFVVNQFGLWLEEFAFNVSSRSQPLKSGASEPIGIGMVILGGMLCVLAAWRYHKVYKQIKQGKVHADHGLVGLVTVLTVIMTVVMVIFMFTASRQF